MIDNTIIKYNGKIFHNFIKRVIIKSLQCHLKLKNENGTPKPCKLLKGAAHAKMS